MKKVKSFTRVILDYLYNDCQQSFFINHDEYVVNELIALAKSWCSAHSWIGDKFEDSTYYGELREYEKYALHCETIEEPMLYVDGYEYDFLDPLEVYIWIEMEWCSVVEKGFGDSLLSYLKYDVTNSFQFYTGIYIRCPDYDTVLQVKSLVENS